MNIIKSLFTVASVISVCIAQISQEINISGTVMDKGGTSIPGAFVMLETAGLADTTGSDGSFLLTGNPVGIDRGINLSFESKQSAWINNGLLHINVQEKSEVDIIAYTLQGKAIFSVKKTMDAGTHCIALPNNAVGVYFYKIKSDNNEFVLKSCSIGKFAIGSALSIQIPSHNTFAKLAKSNGEIDDVIAVTKEGYLNYRVIITNSDTSGIEIKMIECAGTVTDEDGNIYQTVNIGNQVWTVENLRTTKYNDGTQIPHVPDGIDWIQLSTAGYCYYNTTTNANSIKKFGALYNWYVVSTKKLAPIGWHVPSDAEWDTLQNYLIANGYNWDGTTTGNKIAKSIASRTDWATSQSQGLVGNNMATNNSSGFSALPGGCRSSYAHFTSMPYSGHWWSTSESDESHAYYRYLYSSKEDLVRTNEYSKVSGFSVRLVKD